MNLTVLINSYYIFLFSFRRHVFYSDLADSIARHVSLKNFAIRMVANGIILKDEINIHIGRMIISSIEDNRRTNLYAVLADIIPRSDWPLLAAAEQATDVPKALAHLARVVTFKMRLIVQVASNAVLILVAVGLCGGISIFTADIIQQIVETAPTVKFTGFNGLVVVVAQTIERYWPFITLTTIATVAGAIYLAPRATGDFRTRIDEWPIIGLYRDFHSANSIAALSMFLSSGLVLKQALEKLSEGGDRWRSWQVSKVKASLDVHPTQLHRAFSRGLFSPALRARLAALNDSIESFDDAIISLGDTELSAIQKQITTTVKIAGGTIVFFIAIIAITLALGQSTIITQLFNETGY